MKRLKIFIAVVIIAAAILGLMKPKKKVQTPQEKMFDLLAGVVSVISMLGR